MYFLTRALLCLVALQTSCLLANSTSEAHKSHDSLLDHRGAGLHKRYPIALTFDNSVSPSDRATINTAFQDMITLATAAANYDFSNTAGNIDGIYRRYFPQGQETKVQAMFRYLAGIPQTWGGQQLTTPNFGGLVIKRSNAPSFAQAYTQLRSAGNYDITIGKLAMPPILPASIATTRFTGTQSSSKMEMVGAVILHELLHASSLITNPIMSYNSPTDTSIRPSIIDDQKQSFLLGVQEKSYGSYLSTKLKQNAPNLAAINNDNFMYFALEAYWYPIVRPTGGFAPADRECLSGCTMLVGGNCLWCWTR